MLKNIKIKSYKVWKVFKVPSKSVKGLVHRIEVMDDGEMYCDCPALKDCWHTQVVKWQLSGYVHQDKYSI